MPGLLAQRNKEMETLAERSIEESDVYMEESDKENDQVIFFP